MGKSDEEQVLPEGGVEESESICCNAANSCSKVRRLVRFRCVLVLLLSAGVLLSALFWLPPFLRYADQRDLDQDPYRGHHIVANFEVEKPVSVLEQNISKLEGDILDEMTVPNAQVVILSLEHSTGSNITKVVFAVDPLHKNSKISSTSQSLIKDIFEALFTQQLPLRLSSNYGDPFSFEVLKFPGGITVSPLQRAFLLQKVQIYFNFTLNFSIDIIQEDFDDLTRQLRSGLHLAQYENLYITLTNLRGSTVAPPTIVQTSVVLAVGSTPSMPRIKQLAQTITGSHAKNLGLNNTVFGRVKQVRLSSVLQHSLHGGTPSPAPAPLSHFPPHHHPNAHLTPTIAPAPAPKKVAQPPAPPPLSPSLAPAPAPAPSSEASPPGCPFTRKGGPPGKPKKEPLLVPAMAPTVSPQHSTAQAPHLQVPPPQSFSQGVPLSSPLSSVAFAHGRPPSGRDADRKPPSATPSPSVSSSPSLCGRADLFPSVEWAFLVFLALI